MSCKLTEKGIEPCKGLDGVLQIPGGMGTRYQGVTLQTIININTGEFSRHWAVLKSGKHSKKGIVMNYCPFCGEPLLKEVAEEDAKAA